ncbi:SlyX family protein [Undibacterium curvum]|nr:SlyX family protein [Undibacterium curvum]
MHSGAAAHYDGLANAARVSMNWYGILCALYHQADLHTDHHTESIENRMSTEERLIDLEIRLSRQDDLVDTLNTQVYRQQKKIDELEALCTAMAKRLRELAVTAAQRQPVLDERPPHY